MLEFLEQLSFGGKIYIIPGLLAQVLLKQFCYCSLFWMWSGQFGSYSVEVYGSRDHGMS